jgi:hypothetical protein
MRNISKKMWLYIIVILLLVLTWAASLTGSIMRYEELHREYVKTGDNALALEQEVLALEVEVERIEKQRSVLRDEIKKTDKALADRLRQERRTVQSFSNVIHMEGIKEFYRGMFVQCLIERGLEQGGSLEQAQRQFCANQNREYMAENLHGYIFYPQPQAPGPGESTFEMNIPVPRPTIPLLPFVVPDAEKQKAPSGTAPNLKGHT